MEKERSSVAVVTGKVASTCSRMDRFGYMDALHAVYASSAADGQIKIQIIGQKLKVTKMHPVQSIG